MPNKTSPTSTALTIRNMVCDRCRYIVSQLIFDSGLQPVSVDMGSVLLKEAPTEEQFGQLTEKLERFGFEIVDDRRARMIEQAKRIIIKHVRADRTVEQRKLSIVLTSELPMSYGHLTTIFHEVVGITIEQFVILQRTERVKELLQYGELSLAEIADQLGYSSQQYLSTQFKSVTGLTPNQYRTRLLQRSSLDKVGTD